MPVVPQPKRPMRMESLEGSYRDFKERFLAHKKSLALPAHERKPIHLGLSPTFTHRLVQNAIRGRKLGFVIAMTKEGSYEAMTEQISGKVKHLVDAEHLKDPHKKIAVVHAFQKDLQAMKANLRRQQNAIQKRTKIKPGSSQDLINAKSAFNSWAEQAVRGLNARLDYAAGALRELEQRYLAEERRK